MEPPNHRLTFIVRLTTDDAGVLNGVVERVRSGEKQQFCGVEALADAIVGMVERETQRAGRKERVR